MTIKLEVTNWYNNIPIQGVLCWCKVYEDHIPELRIIVRKQSCMPFVDISGNNFNYAAPATAEELRGVLLESEFANANERRDFTYNTYSKVSANLVHKTGKIYEPD